MFGKVSKLPWNITLYSKFTSSFHSSKFFSTKRVDFYAILGVSKTATQTEIKQSYYKLAQIYHPDKNSSPDAKERFSDLSNAYETLSDQQKRTLYDSFGLAREEPNYDYTSSYKGPFDDFKTTHKNYYDLTESDLEDDPFEEFSSFSNKKKDVREKKKGADVQMVVDISFEDALNGITREIKYEKVQECSSCEGNGHVKKHSKRCPYCQGKGHSSYKRGPLTIQVACQKCQGAGILKSECMSCHGNGRIRARYTENIKIPKGVEDGFNIRLKRKGDVGQNGGESGDLILKVHINPDSYYRREGFDIYTNVFLNISQAVLGTTIKVRTLYGPQTITVEKGTQNGDKLKLNKMGLEKPSPYLYEKGDHWIEFRVFIPQYLSEEEKVLFEKISNLEKEMDQKEKEEGEGEEEDVSDEEDFVMYQEEYSNNYQKIRTKNKCQKNEKEERIRKKHKSKKEKYKVREMYDDFGSNRKFDKRFY